MKQILMTKQTNLPITNIDYIESLGSNYANYKRTSLTNDNNALIDILENIIIIVDPTDFPNMPFDQWQQKF